MTVLPGVICVGGVFFRNEGLISAIMLYSSGLVASVSNAMWPVFKYQSESTKQGKISTSAR